MTREEALKILDTIPTIGEQVDALEMAIEALRQVTGKLNNPDDSLLTEDSEERKQQKSKLDLIRREDAQTELMMNATRYTLAHESGGMGHVVWDDELIKITDALDILRALPSADRPKGEWIKATESTWKCSLCKGIMFVESNYCPFCGADMRGDQNETSESD